MSYKNLKTQIIEEYERETNYWCSVLCRVVATIKFLAERGLLLVIMKVLDPFKMVIIEVAYNI